MRIWVNLAGIWAMFDVCCRCERLHALMKPHVLVIDSSVVFELPQVLFLKRVLQIFQLQSTIMPEACWYGAKMVKRGRIV